MATSAQGESKVTGIYAVEGVEGTNQAQIKFVENVVIGETNYYPDKLHRSFCVGQNVMADLYLNNTTHIMLMSSRKLPICSIALSVANMIQLFSIGVWFVVESKIDELADLLERRIGGKFVVELVLNGKSTELDLMEVYPGDEALWTKLTTFVRSERMGELIELTRREAIESVEQRFGKFDMSEPPKNIISLRNYKVKKE
jgi:hypothetical protein